MFLWLSDFSLGWTDVGGLKVCWFSLGWTDVGGFKVCWFSLGWMGLVF
jgi:hypothetical protein